MWFRGVMWYQTERCVPNTGNRKKRKGEVALKEGTKLRRPFSSHSVEVMKMKSLCCCNTTPLLNTSNTGHRKSTKKKKRRGYILNWGSRWQHLFQHFLSCHHTADLLWKHLLDQLQPIETGTFIFTTLIHVVYLTLHSTNIFFLYQLLPLDKEDLVSALYFVVFLFLFLRR